MVVDTTNNCKPSLLCDIPLVRGDLWRLCLIVGISLVRGDCGGVLVVLVSL